MKVYAAYLTAYAAPLFSCPTGWDPIQPDSVSVPDTPSSQFVLWHQTALPHRLYCDTRHSFYPGCIVTPDTPSTQIVLWHQTLLPHRLYCDTRHSFHTDCIVTQDTPSTQIVLWHQTPLPHRLYCDTRHSFHTDCIVTPDTPYTNCRFHCGARHCLHLDSIVAPDIPYIRILLWHQTLLTPRLWHQTLLSPKFHCTFITLLSPNSLVARHSLHLDSIVTLGTPCTQILLCHQTRITPIMVPDTPYTQIWL
jgi:hypothetical protein